MVVVTAARLAALAPRIAPVLAAALAPLLDGRMPAFGAATPLRRAHFLAQACWESAGFTRMEEALDYATPARIAALWPTLADRAAQLAGKPEALANAAYAGRGGNGPEASGDGWRYRGRGLLQLTGRSNYARIGAALNLNLTDDPDQAARLPGAALTALCFWRLSGCNTAADRDDAAAVSARITGAACTGLAARRALVARAKAIFATQDAIA